MKNTILAATAAIAMSVTAASAADLGYGFTAGGEVNAEYNLTAGGDIALVATPELGYTYADMNVTLSTDVDLTDIDFVGFDVEVTYDVIENLEVYAKVSTDADLNFGDVFAGLTFTF